MSVPIPSLKDKRPDTEELVKNEELPEPQNGGILRDSHGIPGEAPAMLSPATLPVEGVTTTESSPDTAAVHIGQVNPGEYPLNKLSMLHFLQLCYNF